MKMCTAQPIRMDFSGLPGAKPFTSISDEPLKLELVTVLDLYEVLKDNYLRKTAALVTEKETGVKKILIRLNAREFKNEAHRQALVKVITIMTSQHRLPCLVQYDRFLRDGDDFYLIQHNYQYGRLQDLLKAAQTKGKPFSEQFIKNWLAHLLVALNALHDKKVAHSNLVLWNIYVDEKSLHLGPTAGFSRILDHPRSFSGGMDQIKVDPARAAELNEYTSPEVIGKNMPSLPHDIWCVGVVAYYLGAMRYPFHDDDPDQIQTHVLRKHPDYKYFKRNGYSDGLKEFVESCLHKDHTQRPNANHVCQHPYIMDDYMKIRAKTAGGY